MQGLNYRCVIQINCRGTFTKISLFSQIKEKTLRPLFHNLKQINNLSLIRLNFFKCIVFEIGIYNMYLEICSS